MSKSIAIVLVFFLSTTTIFTLMILSTFLGFYLYNSHNELFNETTETRKNSDYKTRGATTTAFTKDKNENKSKKENSRKLIGDKTVHIIFTKSPQIKQENVIDLHETLTHPNTEIFNSCGKYECAKATSLNYTQTFLKNEYTKYNNTTSSDGFNLNLEIHDKIYELEKSVEMEWESMTIEKIYDFETQFNEILAKDYPEISLLDPVVFMYYSDNYQNRNSILIGDAFRSYAGYSRAFVNIDLPIIENSSFITHVFIHEMLHLFATSDKYDELGNGCKENGYGNPKLEHNSQTTTDIMCSVVPIDLGEEYTSWRFGDLRKNEVIINEFTAKELGW